MQTPEHTIDCTGDAVVGDEVCFERATFTGSWRNPKFAGNETIRGKIIKDSYGRAKQQHTFTLLITHAQTPGGEWWPLGEESHERIIIKGRNLYREGVHRKPWPDESLRDAARTEKHQRGDSARRARDERRMISGNDFTAPIESWRTA